MHSSSACQVVHWKEGHKNECRAPQEHNFNIIINKSENMCNGEVLKTSKNADSTIVSNPLSLGFFKSFNKTINDERKKLQCQLVNAPHNALTTRSFSRPKTVIPIFHYISYTLVVVHL